LKYLGRYQEAIECFSKALELDPTDSVALYNKATTLNKLKRYQEGVEIKPSFTLAHFGKSSAIKNLGRN
jgi:tetratricopeptide (TPR) repeat protein